MEKYIVWGVNFWRGTARVPYDAIKRCLLSNKVDNDER